MKREKEIVVISSKSTVMATNPDVLIHYESSIESVTSDFMSNYSRNIAELDMHKEKILQKREDIKIKS